MLELATKRPIDEWIDDAVALIRKRMRPEVIADWPDEKMKRALRMCHKAGGVYFVPEKDFITACFLYWPKDIELVEEVDLDELEKLDLSQGPFMHVFMTICPVRGKAYGLLCHRMLTGVNPVAYTTHKYECDGYNFKFRVWRGYKAGPRHEGTVNARI